MRSTRLLSWAILGLALFPIGCGVPIRVSAYREGGATFTEYRTFAWAPADALPTGDPRLDNNPFFEDYFQGAVEKQLAVRGLELAEWGTPDLFLHYHAHVQQRFAIGGTDTDSPSCSGPDCQGPIVDYEAGTYVLDMVDGYTNKLVWRGWAQGSVDGVIDNQDRMRDQIVEAVARMMRLYPDPENPHTAAGRSR